MGLFNTIKKSAEILKNEILQGGTNKKPQKTDPKKRALKKETFLVMAVDHYENNLKKLRSLNPEYKKKTYDDFVKVYKYNVINKPVKLIPEPKNKHDKNAIQVFIAGELIGYISREDNIHVKNILTKHEIKYISSYIKYGEYKVVSLNGTTVTHDQRTSVKVSIGYI